MFDLDVGCRLRWEWKLSGQNRLDLLDTGRGKEKRDGKYKSTEVVAIDKDR